MRFAIRNFRDFEDWVELDASSVTLLSGPNGSGKSAILSALLLIREQRDPFRLSFASGSHGVMGFLDAVPGRNPREVMDIVLRPSVDAAAALFPPDEARPAPVPYDFELGLSYAGDDFDGGASGILVGLGLALLLGEERRELFSIRPCEGGYEFFFGVEEALKLPFVHARAVATDSPRADGIAAADRAIEYASGLVRHSRGAARERAAALLESLKAARQESAMNRELERIVLPPAEPDRFRPLKPKERERSCRIAAREKKYLRSLADIFIAESLAESGLRSMASCRSGREIRLSFYSLFYEVLEASGFLDAAEPSFLARFPAARGLEPRAGIGPESAAATPEGAARLVREAEERYAASLRDAVNVASCRKADGGLSLSGARLGKTYGRAVVDFRAAHPGGGDEPSAGEAGSGIRTVLVPEGGPGEPSMLDLERRRAVLRSFLSGARLAEDVEFLPQAASGKIICIDRFGQRLPLGELGYGPRRIVLVALSLLYLPWGGELVVEEPEAGLDEAHEAAMAALLRLVAGTAGARVVVETRSPAFVAAFGPYRRPQKRAAPRISCRESEDGLSRLVELAPPERKEQK